MPGCSAAGNPSIDAIPAKAHDSQAGITHLNGGAWREKGAYKTLVTG